QQDALGYVTSFGYDALGRRVSVTTPDAAVTRWRRADDRGAGVYPNHGIPVQWPGRAAGGQRRRLRDDAVHVGLRRRESHPRREHAD
ncbi:MAG: RHS repeat protein, partial [Anaerolineae bacterium]|nr:RHS repeat protein [Anaerolineae bacterium]